MKLSNFLIELSSSIRIFQTIQSGGAANSFSVAYENIAQYKLTMWKIGYEFPRVCWTKLFQEVCLLTTVKPAFEMLYTVIKYTEILLAKQFTYSVNS